MTMTDPPATLLSVFDVIGDYLPGARWAEKVRWAVRPDDNGDQEWTLVMEEVWRSPGYAALCDHIRAYGFPHPIRVGDGKVLDGTRLLVAAVSTGNTDAVPVCYTG